MTLPDAELRAAAEALRARGAFESAAAFHKVKAQFERAMMRDTALSAGAKVVGVALLFFANSRTGRAWPSRARLEEETGMMRKAVQRAIAELLERGWFVRHIRAGAGIPRHQATSIYMHNIVRAEGSAAGSIRSGIEPSPQSTTGVAGDQGREVEEPTGTEPETQEISTTGVTGDPGTGVKSDPDRGHGRPPILRVTTRSRSSDLDARERARDDVDDRREGSGQQRPLPLMAVVPQAQPPSADASSAFRDGAGSEAEQIAKARAELDRRDIDGLLSYFERCERRGDGTPEVGRVMRVIVRDLLVRAVDSDGELGRAWGGPPPEVSAEDRRVAARWRPELARERRPGRARA